MHGTDELTTIDVSRALAVLGVTLLTFAVVLALKPSSHSVTHRPLTTSFPAKDMSTLSPNAPWVRPPR